MLSMEAELVGEINDFQKGAFLSGVQLAERILKA